jgi:hypothetical protein
MLRLLALALLAVAGCDSGATVTPPADLAGLDLTSNIDAAGQQGQPCNAFTQQTCISGLHCAVATLADGSGMDVCTPNVPSPIPEGGRCSPFGYSGYVTDFCAVGTTCVHISALQGDRCVKMCFRHSDCDNGQFCAGGTASSTSVPDPFFGDLFLSGCISGDDCDPVAQTGCDPGQSCYLGPFDDVGRVFVCSDAHGTGDVGADCDHQSVCAPGESCSGLGFCRQLCYIHGAQGEDGGTPIGGCPATFDCNAFFGSAGIYGICE